MNHKSLFFAIISAALLTTACDKNKGGEVPEPIPVMDIDVQVNVLTDFTAGVTLIPESADNEYFACILPEEEYYADSAAAAARILEMSAAPEYSEFRFTGNADVIFTDLEAAADYVICTAVYGDETRLSSIAPIMTEEAMERFEISNTAHILDWGQEFEKTNAAFTFRLGSATLNPGENWDYFSDGELINIWAVRKLESLDQVPEDISIFCGIYKSSTGDDDTPGAIVTEGHSNYYTYSPDGETEGGMYLTSAEIQMNESSNGYEVTARFSVDGKEYSCYYKGEITMYGGTGYYGIYGYEPSLKEDITDLDYPLMKYAYYCGEVNGMSKYSLACVNNPDGSSFGGYNKHCIKMEFYVPTQADPYSGIPAGEYPVSAEEDVNTTIAGDYRWYNATSIDLLGSYYYLLDEETFEQTQGFFTSGKITVERNGDEHIFIIDAETWDGYKITGTSAQESLVITDEPEW